MSETPPSPPAGWYPTPDGPKRYWDGEQWLNLPEPDETAPTASGATAPNVRPKRLPKWAKIAIASGAALLLAGSLVTWQVVAAAQEADRQAAAEAAEQAEKTAAAVAAKEKADAEQRERDLKAVREAMVAQIESSVKKMAQDHLKDGLIDGKVLGTDCSPVGGGSADPMLAPTTVFECFVATKDNGDGTQSGYYYSATMNWDSGSFTYGFGQP